MNEIYLKLMTVSENSITAIANEANTTVMTGKDWILLIIPSIISIIGFLVSYFKIKKEFIFRMKQLDYEEMNSKFDCILSAINNINEEKTLYNNEEMNKIFSWNKYIIQYGSRRLDKYFNKYRIYVVNLQKESKNSNVKKQENVLESKEYKKVKNELIHRIKKELYRV